MSVPPTAPPTDTIAMQAVSDPGECDAYYGADVIEKNRCLCDHFPDVALQQGIDCSPYTPIYWYHPDYIEEGAMEGSVNLSCERPDRRSVEFVSDRTGQPYQHFYYAPFGDPMVSQHVGTGGFNSAFRFNAKEYDEETGNYYYGARYYQPKSSIWMGVDALATSYPSMNPYNFVMGNPIMAIDPDGDTTHLFDYLTGDYLRKTDFHEEGFSVGSRGYYRTSGSCGVSTREWIEVTGFEFANEKDLNDGVITRLIVVPRSEIDQMVDNQSQGHKILGV